MATEMIPPQSEPQWKRFVFNPVVRIVVDVVGVASLILSVIFYFASKQERDLVFTVHPARTIIVTAGRPTDLNVEFRGEAIKTDVVGVQVALWNQGKGSVRAGDVLSPLEIRLTPAVPILQASVAKASRSVIALSLDNDTEVLRQGRLPVRFKIMEQGDGGSIQVIYAGPSDVEVSLVGIVEGAGAPRSLRATGQRPQATREPTAASRLFGKVFPWIFVAFLLVVVAPGLIRRLRHPWPRSTMAIVFLVTDVVMLLAAITVGYMAFFMLPYTPEPPFGF